MASSSELRLRGIFGTGFVTFKWQDDDDTEDDVLDTMRMAVVDLDEIKHVLETKITEYKAETKSYAKMKTLCANFNKITDTLIALWRGTHKLQELQTFPTLPFLEHVMRRCYKNSLTNSSISEEFNKNLFDTTDAIFKHLRMNDDDVFIDINCGNGSVVLQMAASGSFKYCYGVSSPDETNYLSETMLVEFTKWMGFYGKDYTEFQIFREEFMSSEMLKLVSESTIIFLKETVTEPALNNQISQLFSQLKEETRVVSLKNCEQFFVSCDKSVDVEDFEGKQCGTRFFVHTVRLKKRPTEQEVDVLPSVSTATSGAPKRRNSAGLSSNKKNNFQAKQASKQEIVDEVCEPAPTIDSLHASLERVLSCYRAQFIKFVDFMQSPEYRQQLEGAVKQELLRKTELEEKLQSLMRQINELNGGSVTLAKRPKNGISDEVNYHSDLLTEVQSLLNQNKELQQQELKLNDEIGHLERIEIVKQCHDQLSNLRNKEDDLSTLNRQYLVSKASEWYQNYIYLSAKVKNLETEVASLEGTKQNVSLTDRQKTIEHFLKSFCKKSYESGIEKQTQPSTASLPKQDVPFSGSLQSLSSQRQASDGIEFEGNPVDKSRLERFSGSAYGPTCKASVMTDHSVMRCVSSDQIRCFSPMTAGSARHLSDPKLSTAATSYSAQTQKQRHRSSSSTDTADSEQGLGLNADGDFRANLRPGSPVSAQNDVLRLLTSISKPENFVHSVSTVKQPLPVSEALRVPASYTTYADQTRSNTARNLAVTNPEVISSGGKGKPAAGKRGKRKRTAFTPSQSDSSVSDRSVDAGNLDALFLAVSLHHMSPRHRDPSHDSTEAQKSNFFESCHASSVSSLPRKANNSTVAMATGQSSLTVPSWSLLHGVEFRTPSTPFSLTTNAPRLENKLPPEVGVDDSHGKHFKKRLHSSNFKLDHDQKSSSKTLPSVSSTEATAPILKYLFTKQETSPAIPTKGSSAFHSDSTSVRHTNTLLTTSSSSSALLPPPKSQADQITAINKSFKGSNLPPQTSAGFTQYLNAWPDALKLRGASWYSLSMNSLLKYSLPPNSSHSNVFGTAHVPGSVTSFALLNQNTTISTKAQMNTLSTSQTSISKDSNQHLVVTTAVSQTTGSQKNGTDT